MLVDGKHYRTIWLDDDAVTVKVIDQRALPHRFVIEDVKTPSFMAEVIKDMHVRGAGLIGAAGGYGMYLAALTAPTGTLDAFQAFVESAGAELCATRPTAVNLEFAVTRVLQAMAAASTGVSRRACLRTCFGWRVPAASRPSGYNRMFDVHACTQRVQWKSELRWPRRLLPASPTKMRSSALV